MLNSPEFYQNLLDNLYEGVYFVDRERRITYWNKGAERISGYPAAKVIGRRCADNILNHTDDSGNVLCTNGCPLHATILDGQAREMSVYLLHAQGNRIPVVVRSSPVYDAQGTIIGAVEVFSDNSSLLLAIKQANESRSENLTDPLTGIGNRRFIEAKLATSLIESQKLGVPCGVLLVDADHFKDINDTFGHENGDKALKLMATTLNQSIRTTDFAGRLDGEEFMVILFNVDESKIVTVSEKIRAVLETSYVPLTLNHLHLTASIGATLMRPDDTPQTIFSRLQELLNQSKEAGRNCVTFKP